jgi:hypothetical protein
MEISVKFCVFDTHILILMKKMGHISTFYEL